MPIRFLTIRIYSTFLISMHRPQKLKLHVQMWQKESLVSAPNCSLCKTQKHRFMLAHSSSHSHTTNAAVCTNNVCFNCLKPGHFSKVCGRNDHCRKCNKLHCTWLSKIRICCVKVQSRLLSEPCRLGITWDHGWHWSGGRHHSFRKMLFVN